VRRQQPGQSNPDAKFVAKSLTVTFYVAEPNYAACRGPVPACLAEPGAAAAVHLPERPDADRQ